MNEIQTFENKDLVLHVSTSVNPHVFDVTKYDEFIDALCGERDYQKEAITTTLRYLLGDEYANLRELAEVNYKENRTLRDKYATVDEFIEYLQLPDKQACSIDLATATGKSFVIYGIARIALAEGAVDQALVLCPSTTIEQGLTKKFRALSADKTLKELLPAQSVVRNPRIVDATTSIRVGDICVENIHATYARTKSAITDSLAGKGARTLVVNDEAHHMTNPTDQALRKWKEFLLNPVFKFHRIVSLSGTCYTGNEYFTDVIYRYPLRDAMEDHVVKLVRYVAEDSSGSENEKFQKIYANHLDNKTKKYRRIKPLTILVTKNIAACKHLTDRLIEFLAKKEKISKAKAADKVLIVTSADEHKANVAKLSTVDSSRSSIEWITSVSMLTEGWDVQNVFQIVPSEERAFNSKLLIAQVLGRGLRVPLAYKDSQPTVTVFNHDKWANAIKYLVDEVLEIERRLYSYPVTKPKDYSFTIHNIDYKRIEKPVEYKQTAQYGLLRKGFITFASQHARVTKTTTYTQALDGQRDERRTQIETQMFPIGDVAQDIVNKLRWIDTEQDTNYAKQFPVSKVTSILKNSLAKVAGTDSAISYENRQRALQAFSVILRKSAKSIRLEVKVDKLIQRSTNDLRKSYIGIGQLRRGATVFWDDNSLKCSAPEDIRLLRELDADETLPRSAMDRVANSYLFKTPLNIVAASHQPERRFVRALTHEQNAKAIDAWIKSSDTGFYSIEYSWRKGEHPKQGRFNPDYFIKKGKDILVTETKMDDDASDENRAKLRYAREHFARLNRLQKKLHYEFRMVSPSSYDEFFQTLRDGKHRGFKSNLEAALDAD